MEIVRQDVAYSVVIPAHNESESLPRLVAELSSVMGGLGKPYELIVVDDGSTDDTVAVLRHLQADGARLRLLELDGNYGQSAAFDAGFRSARGDVLITLDADGQNPPSEIPSLLAALADFDMVCGWRTRRQDHLTKRWFSKFANTLRRSVLDDGIHDTGCSLKVMRRQVVERLKLFHGMHRFLPALARMEGYRVTESPVAHLPRSRGKSHYGIFNRMLGPLMDLCAVYWMNHRCRAWQVVSISDSERLPLGSTAAPRRAAG